MIPPFRVLPSPDAAAVQTDVREFVEGLGDIVGGKLLLHKTIGTAETTVPHYMNAIPTGWLAFSPEASATIWQSRAADSRNLYLIASSSVVTGVWVF